MGVRCIQISPKRQNCQNDEHFPTETNAATMTEGITPEASKRIASHMNDDHAATIHALVTATLSGSDARCKVQNCRMKSVSLTEYTLSYVLCDGDACSMKKVAVPFKPPLASAGMVRPALIAEHHRALQPKFSWLITDPIMRMLFGACILLGVGTALGQAELASRINDTPWASSIVTTAFGSAEFFAKVVIGSWYVSLVAHGLEAVYTAYLCKRTLKMDVMTTLKWFLLNVCTGFPIINKVKELVAVDTAARANKKKA